jgi:ketosteroid isomerase-like protein
MSEDRRVQLVREGFEAWERGDFETATAMYDPDIVTYSPPEVGNSGTFHGVDGFFAWVQAWLEAWERFDQELLSIEPSGERHVIVRVLQHGVGRGSGVRVDRAATWVYEIRDERLVFLAIFFDHDAAVALAREREESA